MQSSSLRIDLCLCENSKAPFFLLFKCAIDFGVIVRLKIYYIIYIQAPIRIKRIYLLSNLFNCDELIFNRIYNRRYAIEIYNETYHLINLLKFLLFFPRRIAFYLIRIYICRFYLPLCVFFFRNFYSNRINDFSVKGSIKILIN